MKAPLGWLAEHADIPSGTSPRAVADALLRLGMEVEGVDSGADGLDGPIVVGRVLSFDEEPQKNGKTIRWCSVDVGTERGDTTDDGDGGPRGIVCGARNFAVDDLVVVSLPGALLPGGFAIAARKTYGHVSDGMICSVRELGIGEDHDGILVLPPGSAAPGDDALDVLGLREAVLDIAVTTDRGYCLSVRGLARETATALGTAFHDIAPDLPAVDGAAYDVRIDDLTGCSRFSVRAVAGLDPQAPTPDWMARRLRQCGVRSISLAVDVTNYVMLETGQPLHAYDRALLRGPLTVRRAHPGEKLTTLDGTVRVLDPADMVVTDESGPIGLGGVMGGASTEIGDATGEVVLEAAHWDADTIARTVRRHHLPSEAARRFERGVDPEIAGAALARCVELLVEHGAAQDAGGYTVTGERGRTARITLPTRRSEQVAGMPIPAADVRAHLEAVGCTVEGGAILSVQAPSWRPDLVSAADLVEEVVRLAGYELLPSVLPAAPAGNGLTARQTMLRAVSRAVADAGFVEVLSFPVGAPGTFDTFGLDADDTRRDALRLANPLSEDEPLLRTTLLPGLLGVAARNVGRGNRDLALSETGLVFCNAPGVAEPVPLPGVADRPTDAQLAALDAALPRQPRRLAVVLCGEVDLPCWWGKGRPASWSDAVQAAHVVADAARVTLSVRPADHAPWHPGRCAELVLGKTEQVVGYAGELHPRVVAALDLPPRTCAMELDLDTLPTPVPARAPVISGYPPVLLDIALVVDDAVGAADVERTVARGAGELLESVWLFDVYRDAARLGDGRRSLAFALRFRAPDRTLTVEEATVARDAAVAAAVGAHGAELRA